MFGHAVVVVQREIDGLDALLVIGTIRSVVRAADRVAGLDPEFGFQRHQKTFEERHAEGIGGMDDGRYFRVDQGRENDGAQAVCPAAFVDAFDHGLSFVGRIDERGPVLAEFNILELGEQAVAKGFGGEAGAVGNEKYGAFDFGHF